jgi:enoyl-CoA hydratase
MPRKPSAPALFRAWCRPLSWSRKRIKVAGVIAAKSRPIAMMTKESVNRSYETTLAEGVRFERRLFHAMFATNDQKEGMSAFAEKRKPKFSNS